MKNAVWVLVFLLIGCNEVMMKKNFEVPESIDTTDVRYKDVETLILQPYSCVRCHSDAKPSGGVSFSSYESAMNSKITPSVDPTQSRFYNAVATGSMPPKSPLGTEEVELIKLWIEQGANP